MPRRKSEVPHVAITNHRIAIYHKTADNNPSPQEQATIAEPATHTVKTVVGSIPPPLALLDKSALGSTQRHLNEAIAIGHWLLISAGSETLTANNLRTALDRLEVAIQSHPVEQLNAQLIVANLIDALLSRFATALPSETDRLELWRKAANYASLCESSTTLSALDRMSATAVLANAAYEYGQFDKAAARYERLTTLRAIAADWYNLGLCYGKLNRFVDAEASFHESIRLDPTYTPPYRSLSRFYANIDPIQAQFYATRAYQLEKAVH